MFSTYDTIREPMCYVTNLHTIVLKQTNTFHVRIIEKYSFIIVLSFIETDGTLSDNTLGLIEFLIGIRYWKINITAIFCFKFTPLGLINEYPHIIYP